jgi:hypothetical protein
LASLATTSNVSVEPSAMVFDGIATTSGATFVPAWKVVTDSVFAVHKPSSSCAVALTV